MAYFYDLKFLFQILSSYNNKFCIIMQTFSIFFTICISVLSVFLIVCLSIHLSLFVHLSVCLFPVVLIFRSSGRLFLVLNVFSSILENSKPVLTCLLHIFPQLLPKPWRIFCPKMLRIFASAECVTLLKYKYYKRQAAAQERHALN